MELQVLQGHQNAAGYIIHRHVRATRLCEQNWIFQQDNSVIHTARRSKDFSITFVRSVYQI